jgi:hypothetical protein
MAVLPFIGQHTREEAGREPAFACIPPTGYGEPGTEIAPFLRPPVLIYGTMVSAVEFCGKDGRGAVASRCDNVIQGEDR